MSSRSPSPDRTRADNQPDVDRFFTCCDTWQIEASAGRVLHNRPEQPETLHAIEQFVRVLLAPIEQEFGQALRMVDLGQGRLVPRSMARAG